MTGSRSLPLFDPTVQHPPYEAVELYLETPVTVGIFYATARNAGHHQIADGVHQLRLRALNRALQHLQTHGGYLKVGTHHPQPGGGTVGRFLPGRLRVTAISELMVEGWTDVARLHDHVYVGLTGVCDEDGQLWPVDLRTLREQVLPSMQAIYLHELQRLLTQALEVQWTYLEEHGTTEICQPALHLHADDYPRVLCTSQPPVQLRWVVRDLAQHAARRAG